MGNSCGDAGRASTIQYNTVEVAGLACAEGTTELDEGGDDEDVNGLGRRLEVERRDKRNAAEVSDVGVAGRRVLQVVVGLASIDVAEDIGVVGLTSDPP